MTITFSVSGDIPSKKNSKQIIFSKKHNRSFLIPGNVYNKWIKQARKELEARLIGRIENPGKVTLKLYPKTRRRADLTNKAESVMDLIVECGVIEDDTWFVVPEIDLRFMGVDKDHPRCEVEIEVLDEERPCP